MKVSVSQKFSETLLRSLHYNLLSIVRASKSFLGYFSSANQWDWFLYDTDLRYERSKFFTCIPFETQKMNGFINPFLVDVHILTPLKTPGNRSFSGVFRRLRMGTLVENGFNCHGKSDTNYSQIDQVKFVENRL